MNSLFDDPDPPRDRREPSQSLFLSWPSHVQDAYCATRDEDSARVAEVEPSGQEPSWYRERAATYRRNERFLQPVESIEVTRG